MTATDQAIDDDLKAMRRPAVERIAKEMGINPDDPELAKLADLRAAIVTRRREWAEAGEPPKVATGGRTIGPADFDGEAVEVPIVDDADPSTAPQSTDLALPDFDGDPFRAMALADEQQIMDEIQGRALEEMVYAFPMDGSTVTGLSWKGVREVVRTINARGFTAIRISPEHAPLFDDVITEEGEPAWEVRVYAEDRRTGGGVWGVAAQPKNMRLKNGKTKPDTFAKTKALSKAQRNALEALIPAELIATLKAQYHAQGRVKKLPGATTEAPDNRPAPLTDDEAKALTESARQVWAQIKTLNRTLLPPGKFNLLVRDAQHDHGRLRDLIAHLESLLETETEIALLSNVLAEACETRKRFDDLMRLVDRAAGGQQGRLAKLLKLIEDDGLQDAVEQARSNRAEREDDGSEDADGGK